MSRIAMLLRQSQLRASLESIDGEAVQAEAADLTAEITAEGQAFEEDTRVIDSGEAALEAIGALDDIRGTSMHTHAIVAISETFFQANGGVSILPSLESAQGEALTSGLESAIGNAVKTVKEGLVKFWKWLKDLFIRMYNVVAKLWGGGIKRDEAVLNVIERPTSEMVAAAKEAVETDQKTIKVRDPKTNQEVTVSAEAIVHPVIKTPEQFHALHFNTLPTLVDDVLDFPRSTMDPTNQTEMLAAVGKDIETFDSNPAAAWEAMKKIHEVASKIHKKYKACEITVNVDNSAVTGDLPDMETEEGKRQAAKAIARLMGSLRVNINWVTSPTLGDTIPRIDAVRIYRAWLKAGRGDMDKISAHFKETGANIDKIIASTREEARGFRDHGKETGDAFMVSASAAVMNACRHQVNVMRAVLAQVNGLIAGCTSIGSQLRGTRSAAAPAA